MSVSLTKEVEHRACLVPRPTGSREHEWYYVEVTGAAIRAEAERFGLEVIDIHWIKSVLFAIADRLEGEELLVAGTDCPHCGVSQRHVRGCAVLKT